MASRSGYVVQGQGADRGYALDRQFMVQRGRTREFVRLLWISFSLALVQVPLVAVALGWMSAGNDADLTQAARLSLIADALFIVSYLYIARRAVEMARANRVPEPWRTLAQVGAWLVVVGAALDVWEDVRLWTTFSDTQPSLSLSLHDALPLAGMPDRPNSFSALMWTAVLLGLLILFTVVALPAPAAPRPVRADKTALVAPSTTADTNVVICCSGGGIRATAFSLGGLEALQDAGIYRKASSVIGVSGGGYIAAAAHVLRWRPGVENGDAAGEWPKMTDEDSPFALDSPETAWVRRHTRYVLNSVSVGTDAMLSLLFGIAVNLLLVTAVLFGTTLLLAWLFLVSGRIKPWPDLLAYTTTERPRVIHGGIDGSYSGDWHFLAWVWVVPVAGLALFIGTKFWDRFQTLRLERRRLMSGIGSTVLWIGVVLVVLLVGVPALLAWIAHYTATSDSALAGLLYQLGFVPHDVCKAIVTSQSGCGTSEGSVSGQSVGLAGSVSFVTIVASILAVLGSAKGAASDTEATTVLGNLAKSTWKKIKDPIVPYTALGLILAVLASVFLVMVMRRVEDIGSPGIWKAAAVIGGLIALAKIGTEPNRTSMHSFFRERISDAFLVRRGGNRIDPVDYHRALRYSSAAPRDGGPGLVSCAVANVTDEDLVPSKRGCTPFVFDHQRIGLTDRLVPEAAGLRNSATYEFAADERYRVATIPAATAISAAAFSPLAGRENVHLGPYRAVLALGNARLGVWLPNPLWVDEAFLVKGLLARRHVIEAARLWADLDDADRAYLRLSARQKDGLARGELAARLQQALADVETAMGTQDPQKVEDARRQAAFELLAAQVVDEKVRLLTPDGDPIPVLRAGITRLTPPASHLNQAWAAAKDIFHKPGLSRLVKEAVGQASVYDRFLYVTDGGHYDNLGLVEALRRRPDHVVVLDASNDPEDTFRTLGRAIATARMDLDCEVTIDPRDMERVGDGRANVAWCTGSYRFASDGRTGRILMAKAIMLGNLSWDIDAYAGQNKEFPRTSTTNQLYGEFDFEAYRALGCEAVNGLLASKEYRENPILDQPGATRGQGRACSSWAARLKRRSSPSVGPTS